ncbi:AbrB/MazE/SpoVT family DNA-binding domain-containing protein [Candidatus Bathyarchaeota archaeon]|nr:AbrB/MazE/SpoVT family DNA-binding domain-containing protein [Candidatus Bathyarchaeota archaeon]
MSLTFISRVGKKRTLVIPKAVSDRLGLEEGCRVRVTVDGERVVLEPLHDAVWLSLHGRKIARVTLEELERESVEQQERYIGPNQDTR